VVKAAITIGGASAGWVRACVLLLLAEAPAHGYELLTDLEGFGAHCVDTGTLYRVLRRTELDGFTTSCWQPATSGPARRIYSLTTLGKEALEDLVIDLDRTQELTGLYVARARRMGASLANG